MERFESLINSLKTGYETGAERAKLLDLIDQMRFELAKVSPEADNTRAPVSIVLPAGYQQGVSTAYSNSVEICLETKENGYHEMAEKGLGYLSNSGKHDLPEVHSQVTEMASSMVSPTDHLRPNFRHTVPKPPAVIVEEVVSENPIFSKEKEFSNASEVTEMLVLEDESIELGQEDAEGEEKNEEDVAFLTGLPFDLPEHIDFSQPNTGNQGFHNRFLQMEVSSLIEAPKSKEVHEILANRVVAKPGQPKMEPKVLADTLGKTKINDLRKAIGINDRFRYIKSLFRADDSLFDRSVKTINNFNIQAEAEYWMQRELVIKLGWNEEDELVQEFYQLVNRRFL